MTEFRAISAIGHVLRSAFGNLGFAVRVSWPWMVLILLLQLLTILLFPELQHELLSASITGWSALSPQFLFVVGVTAVASFIAFSSIAVNWHRYILLDEEAEGWDRLRFDAAVMRYMGYAFLVQLISGFVMAVGAMGILVLIFVIALVAPEVVTGIASTVLFTSFGFWCAAMMQRLFIRLPAVAIERSDYGFGDAWADSRGNTFRLIGFMLMMLAVAILCLLLLFAPAYLLGVSSGGVTLPAQFAVAIVQFIVNWAMLIIGVTSLTTLYGIFAEGREV